MRCVGPFLQDSVVCSLLLTYAGSGYSGWADVGPRSCPSVASVVQDKLSKVNGEKRVELQASSRTDKGVRAEGQVAAAVFEHGSRLPLGGDPILLRHKINRMLPDDIRVRQVAYVKGAWDPRTNLGKRYRYTINLSRYSDPLLQSIEWHRPQPRDRPLDIRVMQLAAGALVGEGDFRGFTASLRGSVDDRSSSTCNLQRVDVEEREGGRIDLVVEGDRFLYHMVRLMAGALVSAGEGAVDPDQLAIAVQTGRSPVGKAGSPVRLCAPPEGLCLERVFFLPELDPFGGTMAEETLLDAAPPDDMLTRSDVDRFAASTASTGGG